jgi:capsid portal protein
MRPQHEYLIYPKIHREYVKGLENTMNSLQNLSNRPRFLLLEMQFSHVLKSIIADKNAIMPFKVDRADHGQGF